jgi:hypothetical protein
MIAMRLKTVMSTFLKVCATLCILSAAHAVGGQQQKLPTSAPNAQVSSKPIFTDNPPFLCVGGGFVAMAGISSRARLIVIAIDANGIEAPHAITSVGDAVFGMQCSGSHIELLVNDYKSRRFLTVLYTVQQHPQGLTTIREEQREDPEDLNLPTSMPTPPAAEHRRDSFDWVGSRAGAHMRGDWYVWVPQVVYRTNNTYEVHFVSTDMGDVAKLAVTLLEETLDKKKITKSVPLVHIEAPDVND